jgi:hypothetical protein
MNEDSQKAQERAAPAQENIMKHHRLILCIVLLLCSTEARAQLTLSIQMDPSPSPYIADWRSNPNTIRFLVNNPTRSDVAVRFSGYIEGVQRGRVAETNVDAAVPPVMIPPGSSSFNAVDVYLIEEGVVLYRGESAAETRRSGRLPEDDFRLCVQLVAYDVPHEFLSPLACTSFSIRLLQAPALIAPANTARVTADPAFQWTTVPMGRGKFARYRLTLIELDPGQDNVSNAMRTNLPLIERDGRTVPVYQYQASDPPLEKGHRYAWQVEAYDEEQRYTFRDNGQSEIWSFTYDPPVPPGFRQQLSEKDRGRTTVSPNINITPNLVFGGMTRFRGTLKATWYKSRIPDPRSIVIPKSGKNVKPGTTQTQPSTPPVQTQQGVQTQQLQQVALAAGVFSMKEDKTMGGIHLKLYRRHRTVPQSAYYPYQSGGKQYEAEKLVATTTTRPDGTFEFTFFGDDSTGRILENAEILCGSKEFQATVHGDLYRYYQIEVSDAHLCSPSDEFKVQPGETFDAGTLFSLVRSYIASIEVRHAWGEDSYVLSGMNVSVIRGSRPFDVPSNEGPLDPHEPTGLSKMGFGNSEFIGKAETDMQGGCLMPFLAKNAGAGDTYQVMVTSSEESERYYHGAFRSFDFGFLMDEVDEAGKGLTFDRATFNEDYQPGDMRATVRVDVIPKKPRISGTLHRYDNPGVPLPNTNVLLYRRQVIPILVASCTTNDSGGFVFDNLIPTQNNTYYYIVVDKPGYKYHREPPVGEIKVPMGVKKFFPILLEPKLMVKGRLIDESGRPVAGKIRLGNGALVHTEKKYFVVPQQVQFTAVPSNPVVQQSQSALRAGTRQLLKKKKPKLIQIDYKEEFTSHAVPGLQMMHIVPDNLQDFLSDELLVLLPNTMEDVGDFVVYRRAHRLAVRAVTEKISSGGASGKKGQPSYSASMNQNQFSLTPPAYEPVPGARITVNGMEADSVDAEGVSYFVWMSPGQSAEVVVRGPKGSDFVTKELNIPVPDDTPDWMELDVPLTLGGNLTGLVTVGTVPIPDARVMLYDNPGNTEPLQTRTDANGQFTLHAVPAGTHLFLAAKSQSPYIGDTVQAYIPRGGSATRNFELKAYNDMDITRLMGFPIEVTALDSTGGKVLLSGQFVDIPPNDHFALADENATLAFMDIVIVASSESNAEGLPLAQPEALPLQTEADELALTAFTHFGASQFDLDQGIHLDAADGRGRINGRVSVDPASFQFGSGSLSFGSTQIGLARDLSAPDRLIIPALTSDAAIGHDDPRGYYAGMEDGSTLEFTFYSFEADVDSSGCFFNRDTLSLPAVLHTDIGTLDNPDLALDIGTIRAHHDNVEDITGGSDVIIPLGGDWTMRGKSWTLDQNGLRLDSGHVDAVLVQIPFTGLQILPTEIEYGSYALDEMTLSNTATINFTGDPYFTYDVGTNDWKVGAAPSLGETTCGYIDALPGMASGDKILIESFYLKSNGAKNFKPYSGNNLTLYNVAGYAINAMYAKNTYIQFGGNLDLGIPGLPLINLVSNYGREGGEVVFTHDPVTETISVNGVNIKFKTSGGDPPQWFDGNGYHANVDVYEDGAFRLASMLHRTPAKTDIIVKEGEEVPIGTVKMTDVEGAMEVVDDAWTLFWFEGDLINNNQGGRLHFTVQGDIVANDQEIGVDQIETPFGDIALVYNFQEQQLEGTLHVEQDLSGTSIVGDATLLISGVGKGWYFFCGASFELPQPKVDGTAAFAVGDFLLTQEQLDQFASYSYKNKGLPPQFHDFNGFFFEGTVKFPPPVFCPNFDFDFGLVSAHLTCQVGANARFGMNFGPVDTYFIAIRAIGNLEAGVGASIGIACAGLTAGILIEPNIEGMYQSNGVWYVQGDFPITLYGSTYAGWGICDSDCEGSLCDKESLSASITLGLLGYVGSDDKYFKFYFK